MPATLSELIRIARLKNASDLHIIQGLPPALRVNGEIVIASGEALSREQVRELTLSMLNETQINQLETTRELCFSVYDPAAGRLRVTVYHHAGIPELAVRLCALEISDAETLGLPSICADFARKSNGLVLITGPTGVGKTTTLNYMVDLINRERRCKIVMIEDPVEYLHKPIRSLIVQQEVYTDVISFPRALIHVLRQNPDVIVIGEMRELETIATALTAAETGHLVLATLHTPNVMQTMERIISVFPAQQQKQIVMQLANSLQGVVAQDLLPRADGTGLVLAHEILVPTMAVRNHIRENAAHKIETVLMTGRKDGMISMDICLSDLYHRAIISYDTAVSRARDPNLIKKA
ncbi:MAG: PilT/PilU family type 4a pilus ATPase [bacterium]|nr:PilT/PilU family type 4a pilus ATPase [Candidatus Sumerlaeota bacterium]